MAHGLNKGSIKRRIMKLTTRISASGFIEIKVDEIETIIFKGGKSEINEMIYNLQDVIEDLNKLKR